VALRRPSRSKLAGWGAIVAGLSLAAPALASEGGGGSSLIEPQIGTIFWTLVTFFALVLVLGRYAWKPLVGALEARERAIREDLEAAARRRDEAQALVAEQRELLTAARRERAEAMDAGRRDAIVGEARRLGVDEHLVVTGVVEERDATHDQRAIRDVNAGLYALDAAFLRGTLEALKPDNAQGEYYLPDVIGPAVERAVHRRRRALRLLAQARPLMFLGHFGVAPAAR